MGEQTWPDRRKTIIATFEKFVALCEELEGASPLPSPPTKPQPSAKQATVPVTANKPTKKNR